MDFNDSPEQAALRDAVRDFAGSHPSGDDTTWKRLAAELGVVGLALPESVGGAGASFAEVAVVIEELGRELSSLPYLPTAVVATLLGQCAGVEAVAAALASGDARAAIVTDGLVLHGDVADHFVVVADGVVRLVDRADVTIETLAPLDQTRSLARVQVPSGVGVELAVDASFVQDLLWTALAIESIGGAERIIEITVDYLKTRIQFGKPIGSFQALKHRAADLVVAVEGARSLAQAAVWAAAHAPHDLPLLAPMAKLQATEAFWLCASESIQLHGGIGFTWEHSAHLYFKRAKTTQLLAGTPTELRQIIGQRALILGGDSVD